MAQLQSTGVTGSLVVTGTITAQEFHTEFVSSSILHESGSTVFGNTADDTHNFTGSLNVLGSITGTVNGYLPLSAGSGFPLTGDLWLDDNSGASPSLYLQNGSNNYWRLLNGSTGIFSLKEGTSDRITILPGGNVGIGTTNPGTKLDIAVTPSAAWMKLINANETAFNLTTYNNGTNNGTTAYAFKHGLYYNGAENAAVTFYRGGSSVGGFLTFTTNNGTERMRIDSSGNVGIGTTSPGSKLHLNNSATLTPTYQKFTNGTATTGTTLGIDADGDFIINNGEAKEIKLYTNDSQRVTIQSGGNVGIGTTNPGKKLDVNGSFKLGTNAYIEYGGVYPYTITTANTAGVGNLVFSAGLGSAAYESRIDLQGTNTAGVAGITLSTAATARMVITADGDVGIGTTSPGATLELKGSTAGETVLDIQGTQGQLFAITDSLVGDIFSVSDISGVPILNVNSSGVVNVDGTLTIDGAIAATNLSGTNTGDQTDIAGNAATVTTNANLTGGVTSVGNAATVVTNANLTGGVTSVGNAATVVTNANLTGGVTSVGNAATVVTNANLTGGVTSVGNAATVVTNANLTGHVTSVGNASVLGSFTTAELNAAITDGSINSQTDFVSAANGGTFSGTVTIEQNGDALNLRSTTNSTKPRITFSSDVPAAQIGFIEYSHANTDSYGSGESFVIGGTETTVTILADGKLMYNEGIYSKPATGTGAGTRKDSNWDTAYGWGNHADGGYTGDQDLSGYLLNTTDTLDGYLSVATKTVAAGGTYGENVISLTGTSQVTSTNTAVTPTNSLILKPALAAGYSTDGYNLAWEIQSSANRILYYRTSGTGALSLDVEGTVTANGITLTGNQTLPSDFVSAASGGTFGGAITVTGEVEATSLDINGAADFTGKVNFQGDAAIEGGTGYGVFKGYTANDNHFISVRGIVANTSTLTITGGHQTTFVEQADAADEGWYFKSNSTGTYREIARIDGLNEMYLGGNQVFHVGHKPTYSEIAGTVPTWNQNTTGQAALAAKVSINSGFGGTYPMLVEVESNGIIYNNTNVTYNGTSNTLTSPNFSGNLTGNLTGTTAVITSTTSNDYRSNSNWYGTSNGFWDFRVMTGGSSKMRILANGNVGINETNPGVKLQLVSADEQLTKFSSSVADQLAYSQINASSSTSGVFTAAAALELVGKANGSGHGRHAWIGAEGTSNTTFETKIKFKIRGETASGYDWTGSTEAPTIMTLEGSGNVGIGTTTPNAKLEVKGSTAGETVLDIQGTQGQLFAITDSLVGDIFSVSDISGVPILNVNSSGTSYFDGNLGIGTTSPSAKLEIIGDATGDDTAQLIIKSGGVDNNSIIHFTDDEGDQVNAIGSLEGNMLTLASQNELVFKTNTSSILGSTNTKMTILTGGNVGIGTITPASKLEVYGSAPFIYITDDTETESGIIFRDIQAGMSQAAAIKFSSSDNKLRFYNNDTTAERMVIDVSGNVGIGTNSPVDGDLTINAPKLHVRGPDTSGAYNLVARFQGGNDADFTGAAILINHANDRGLLIQAGRKDSDREVAYFNLVSSSGAITSMLTMGKYGNDYNVGIGTNGPAYKLDVTGTIRATGDIIAYSDARVKENIKTIDSALDKVSNLRGVEFNKIGEEIKSIGVIAQEIEKVIPEVVRVDDKGMKSVAYGNITGVLIEAIKEQQTIVNQQQKEINTLKELVGKLINNS